MNKTRKILIGILIILVLVITLFVVEDIYRNRNLEIKYNNCNYSNGELEYIENSILNVQWKDNNLIVRVRWSYGGCCDENLKPYYQVEKDSISIMIPKITGNFLGYNCNCHCCYDIDFKLKDIEQKDYQILLYETKSFGLRRLLVDEEVINNTK